MAEMGNLGGNPLDTSDYLSIACAYTLEDAAHLPIRGQPPHSISTLMKE